MKFKTDFTVDDSSGNNAYVFYIENMFDPATYLVRGDSFEDAYEWFLCDPRVENELAIADDQWIADYIDGWHGPATATLDDLGAAYMDGAASGVTMNDNGRLICDESVKGRSAADWGRIMARHAD